MSKFSFVLPTNMVAMKASCYVKAMMDSFQYLSRPFSIVIPKPGFVSFLPLMFVIVSIMAKLNRITCAKIC